MCRAANEEYYQLQMINDSQPSGLDVSSYTIEEIDSITSEYTLKNNVSHQIIFKLIEKFVIMIFSLLCWCVIVAWISPTGHFCSRGVSQHGKDSLHFRSGCLHPPL